MFFVYFQKPYVTNAQMSGKIRPNEQNAYKMEMSDNRLIFTKSPKYSKEELPLVILL